MKRPSVLLLPVLLCGSALAGPVEIKIERKVLDKEERIHRPKLQAEEQTTALTIGVTNRTGKDAAMTVEWAVVVGRAGNRSDLLVTGSETLSSVGNTQTSTVQTDAFPVIRTRAGKQDVEYKVIVKQDGREVAKSISIDKFDQIAAAAEPQKRERRKKGKSAE